MYLDIFDELRLNKKLIKLTNFKVAAYWAELCSVLKQVVKKQTADEQGFFTLDRDYIQRETTLTVSDQLACEAKLALLGVLAKDETNPNRITISVADMISLITNEEVKKLRKDTKPKAEDTAKAKAEAKREGMIKTMLVAVLTEDQDLRSAYARWIGSILDSKSRKLTRAIVEVFEDTINSYTQDKNTKLRIIDLAIANNYVNADWVISRIDRTYEQKKNASIKPTTSIPTEIKKDIVF